MRTLEKNKTDLWVVNPATQSKVLDENGFETGEMITTFGTPVKIRMGLYPANGLITSEIFGKDYVCDQLAISNDVVLLENSLIFTAPPVSNYPVTYTYRVDRINKSLNTSNYALKKRT